MLANNAFGALANDPGPVNAPAIQSEDGEEVEADWLRLVKPNHDAYVRVTDKIDLEALPQQCSLLAVSNPQDLLVVGGNADIKLHRLSALQDLLATAGKDALPVATPLQTIPLPSRPAWIRLALGDQIVVVALTSGRGVLLFRINEVLNGINSPFHTFDSNIPTELLDVLPNPAAPSSADKLANYVVLLAKEGFVIADVEQRRLSAPLPGPFTCACWSVKGKQIVVGRPDGKLVQYDSEGTPKREVPTPPGLEGQYEPAFVAWLENDLFLVGYGLQDAALDDPLEVFVIHRNKASISFTKFMDPNDTMGVQGRSGKYRHFTELKSWGDKTRHLAFIVSGAASEIAVLHGLPAPDKQPPKWELLMLEETARGILPAAKSGVMDDTSVVGLDFDLTSTKPVRRGLQAGVELPDLPPLPRLMALSQDGFIVAFNIENPDAGAYPGMIVPSVSSSSTVPSTAADIAMPSGAATPSASAPAPPSAFAGSSGGASSGFGSTSFGSSSTSSQPQGLSSSPFGQNSQPASSAFGVSAAPAFGSSGFGKQPSGAPSAFGQSAFGQSSSTSPVTPASTLPPTAFGQSSFGKASTTPSVTPASSSSQTSAFGQSSFGKTPGSTASSVTPTTTPGPAFGSSGFGQKPAAFGQSSFGQSSTSSALRSSAGSAFGQSGFGQAAKPASSTASAFGQAVTGPSMSSGFGAFSNQSPSPSGFGSSSFGQTGSPSGAFGSSTQISPSTAFGQSSSSNFAGFGQKPGNVSAFGGFGQNAKTETSGFAGFGKSPSPAPNPQKSDAPAEDFGLSGFASALDTTQSKTVPGLADSPPESPTLKPGRPGGLDADDSPPNTPTPIPQAFTRPNAFQSSSSSSSTPSSAFIKPATAFGGTPIGFGAFGSAKSQTKSTTTISDTLPSAFASTPPSTSTNAASSAAKSAFGQTSGFGQSSKPGQTAFGQSSKPVGFGRSSSPSPSSATLGNISGGFGAFAPKSGSTTDASKATSQGFGAFGGTGGFGGFAASSSKSSSSIFATPGKKATETQDKEATSRSPATVKSSSPSPAAEAPLPPGYDVPGPVEEAAMPAGYDVPAAPPSPPSTRGATPVNKSSSPASGPEIIEPPSAESSSSVSEEGVVVHEADALPDDKGVLETAAIQADLPLSDDEAEEDGQDEQDEFGDEEAQNEAVQPSFDEEDYDDDDEEYDEYEEEEEIAEGHEEDAEGEEDDDDQGDGVRLRSSSLIEELPSIEEAPSDEEEEEVPVVGSWGPSGEPSKSPKSPPPWFTNKSSSSEPPLGPPPLTFASSSTSSQRLSMPIAANKIPSSFNLKHAVRTSSPLGSQPPQTGASSSPSNSPESKATANSSFGFFGSNTAATFGAKAGSSLGVGKPPIASPSPSTVPLTPQKPGQPSTSGPYSTPNVLGPPPLAPPPLPKLPPPPLDKFTLPPRTAPPTNAEPPTSGTRSMSQLLEKLVLALQTDVKSVEAMLKRNADYHSKLTFDGFVKVDLSDLDKHSALPLSSLKDVDSIANKLSEDLKALQTRNGDVQDQLAELQSAMMKAELQNGRADKLLKASQDPSFSNVAEVRDLDPRQAEAQKDIRRTVQSVDSRMDNLEKRLISLKRRVDGRQNANAGGSALDRIQRSVRGIDERIRDSSSTIDDLVDRVSNIRFTTTRSPSLAARSTTPAASSVKRESRSTSVVPSSPRIPFDVPAEIQESLDKTRRSQSALAARVQSIRTARVTKLDRSAPTKPGRNGPILIDDLALPGTLPPKPKVTKSEPSPPDPSPSEPSGSIGGQPGFGSIKFDLNLATNAASSSSAARRERTSSETRRTHGHAAKFSIPSSASQTGSGSSFVPPPPPSTSSGKNNAPTGFFSLSGFGK